MRSYNLRILAAAVSAVILVAAPQRANERDTRAREYIQFLVSQLDQWTQELPQAYNMAMMQPPVVAARLSEGAKAGAENLRAAVLRLATLSKAADLPVNAEFRAQLERTITAASPLNEALGAQRFPEGIQGDWVPIRTNLNSLVDIYKVTGLAVFDPPGPVGGGRGGAAAPGAAGAAVPAGAVTGFIVDQRCSLRGKAMWVDAQCVLKCVRDGDKVVLVTEAGKVLHIANQDKVEAESYGQRVAITGKTDGDTLTVATLQIL
jgi:hypothetical protein